MMLRPPRPEPWEACWRAVVVLLCLLSVVEVAAQGIVLHLRNGDRLTGILKSEDTNRVVLATSWNDALSVPVAEILRREIPVVAGAAQIPTNVPPAAPIIPALPPASPAVKVKAPKYWAADIQLGFDVLFSEKKQQIYTGRSKVTYARNHFRNIFDYLFSYGRTDGITSANRMDGSVKTDFDVYDDNYVYNQVSAGYDEIRRIDRRYEIGPGVGYHLLRLTNFVLNVESGLNYQTQLLDDGRETELFYHRFAEDFTWKLAPRFSLDEKFEFLPQVGNWGAYRFRLETNLRYLLRNNLSLNLTLIDQYDTRPARSVNQNDLQVRSSFGLKF